MENGWVGPGKTLKLFAAQKKGRVVPGGVTGNCFELLGNHREPKPIIPLKLGHP